MGTTYCVDVKLNVYCRGAKGIDTDGQACNAVFCGAAIARRTAMNVVFTLFAEKEVESFHGFAWVYACMHVESCERGHRFRAKFDTATFRRTLKTLKVILPAEFASSQDL